MTQETYIDFAQPLGDGAGRMRYRFGPPCSVLQAHTPAQVREVLAAVHAAAQRGQWCVGYVRYEAASAFDGALQTHPADGPLAWFGVHDTAEVWDGQALPAGQPAPEVQWRSTLTRDAFGAAVQRIQAAIAQGEFYQVNYTAPLHGEFCGPPRADVPAALFAALRRAQPGGYAALLPAGAEHVLSVSPELFFDWREGAQGSSQGSGNSADCSGQILARPMKGTAPRGATPEQDEALAEHLRTAPKERAENVMIVDLLRNDLSRIAQPHSVRVPTLFATAPLPTVWQMTSDVVARTRPGTTLVDVFAALFPCGSVTGAPKVRAMEMIHELETGPRGVYCGAVGVVRPAGPASARGVHPVAATFNVPIRTVVLRSGQQGGAPQAVCGIGSGITSGAEADAEWNEWRHKRGFVERASMPFEILETLALEAGQLRYLSEHISRMATAAQHFGFAWDEERVRQCLQAVAAQHEGGLWRVRLLLDAAGQPRAEAFAMQPTPAPVLLQLADQPMVQAHSEFTRFKTTRRAHYDVFTPDAAAQPGVFDVLLYNEAGEITECTRGNIAALLPDGRWVTPPLTCGLLPGVGRAVALREGRVVEAVLRVSDVPQVREWAFVNSLRGWLGARVVPSSV